MWSFMGAPLLENQIRMDIDVVHAVSLGYPIATRKPFVVTVHDIGPITHPQYFKNTSPWIMRRSLKQAIEQAAQIICVSKSTADELISVAGDSVRDRVQVIYEGVSDRFFAPPPVGSAGALDIPGKGVPYILSTGKISPRKNIQGVVSAFASIVDKIPHHLVLVGGEGWNVQEIYSQLRQSKIRSRVHLTGYISDEKLRSLYHGASAYVHPSYYEGFGLTNLEAMASGCPVITSNVFSLPEIAGDSAILVAPDDIKALTKSIENICTNPDLAEEYRAKGISRASQFRWSTCAEKVIEVYEKAAKQKPY